ncbi:MAG TPA: methylmalonyl-CoA mutase family protein, partial [Acidimicrobiales bacterium]|nr:methylmalonyl-CoA mutase family protein [Acidimicrobiales bacterium]
MARRDDWQKAFDASPQRDVLAETMSGVPIDAVYGPDDGEFPGQYPFTRGPYASMYRSKLWTMRMFAGFGTPEDTNARFKEILRAGGSGLS